jgi:nitric oxide reductase subunit B
MHTLPQINLYTHGTQWSASHGHLAFFGAYATINIAFFYLAIQHWRGAVDEWRCAKRIVVERDIRLAEWGVIGMMTIVLLIAGYEQSFIERAVEGSTWGGYFTAQNHPSFQSAMV